METPFYDFRHFYICNKVYVQWYACISYIQYILLQSHDHKVYIFVRKINKTCCKNVAITLWIVWIKHKMKLNFSFLFISGADIVLFRPMGFCPWCYFWKSKETNYSKHNKLTSAPLSFLICQRKLQTNFTSQMYCLRRKYTNVLWLTSSTGQF